MTKYFEVPSRAEMPKFCGTPPTRKPGASPACSSNQASSAEVVVLPCVPATASTCRPCSTFSASHCGPEVYGKPSLSTYSIAALRSEEHTSELQSLLRISYADFCSKKQ